MKGILLQNNIVKSRAYCRLAKTSHIVGIIVPTIVQLPIILCHNIGISDFVQISDYM